MRPLGHWRLKIPRSKEVVRVERPNGHRLIGVTRPPFSPVKNKVWLVHSAQVPLT